jgi:hypothetical protein
MNDWPKSVMPTIAVMHRQRYVPAFALFALLLGSCAAQPDHFYGLSTLPAAVVPPSTGFNTHVILSISIPSLVDRRQMTVDAADDQVVILEHERWAAPLTDLITQTLARDIEQRRPGVLVADRGFDQPGIELVRIKVDIVRLTARRAGRATLEAHWRIEGRAPPTNLLGGETFSSPIEGADYAAIARAFSVCVASLADRLSEKLPSQ